MDDTATLSLEAIDPGAVSAGIVYHDDLDPRLFGDEDQLHLEVRLHMFRIALEFYRFLDVPGLVVQDIIFTGSSAAYNYTPYSDCDIHIVVDFSKTSCPGLAENLFTTKKALWGSSRKIDIRGIPVELYVEDTRNPVTAQGVYSILKNDWLRKPSHSEPTWDDSAVFAKTDACADEIDHLIATNADPKSFDAMMAKIKRMRQSGLAKGGEFSAENLAFKALRNLGYLDRLWDAKTNVRDDDLSLD